MPRGGARVGAGRKPKRPKASPGSTGTPVSPFAAIDGGRADEGPALSGVPPADLPEDQRDFWSQHAKRALDLGTLTLDTVPAFRLLCELDAEKTATKATIDRDGRTYIKVTVDGSGQEHQELKAHPLKGDYRQLSQRVEALLARFMLAPFGKPPTPTRRRGTQPIANPWAAIAAKR